MSTNYYQDELNYLRAMGKEFADRHPESASLLGAGARDPDVERLLQGFAFLTARLHERLDDQFSQVAEGFLHVLWPEVLKPVPSLVMTQFHPDHRVLKIASTLERGLKLQSTKFSWGYHQFQTCRPVRLYPFRLTDVRLSARGESSLIHFIFELNSGVTLAESDLADLPIQIFGDDPRFTHGWFMWLTQYVRNARLVSRNEEQSATVELQPVGFDVDDSLFAEIGDEIPGHRILREFFALPERFLSFRVNSLAALKEMEIDNSFELQVEFDNRIPTGPIREIAPDSFRLYCTPAVNLFESVARFTLDHSRTEYLIRSDEYDIAHHEIVSVTEVTGMEQGPGGKRITYRPFYNRRTATGDFNLQPSYRLRFSDMQLRRENRPLTGRECFISFDFPEGFEKAVTNQSISVGLLCAHRGGATELKTSQLCQPTEGVPAYVTFENITLPTAHRDAPRTAENLWFLVSSFSVSKQTLSDIDHLKSVLAFHARSGTDSLTRTDRWTDGLRGFEVKPGISAVGGTPLRTLDIIMDFDCEEVRISEFYLFGVAVAEFLRSVATINSRLNFSFRFRNNRGQLLSWPHREGSCTIM